MKIQPFSEVATRSLVESTARINIWEGAVRSSKTFTSLIRWIEYCASAPEGPLLMVGKTERSLARNILDPLKEILGSKGIRINRGDGVAVICGRLVYLSGANDERSEQKIRGLTLAGAYGDELTLWPESFFTMLLSRLSVPGAKLFGTTNPDFPKHWLKEKYLDRQDELDLKSWHFELKDNLSLNQPYIDAISSEYQGLWRKRYIEGLWVIGTGSIYDMFDPEVHVVDEVPDILKYYVSIDYGTVNPFVALFIGIGVDNCIYILDEFYYDSSKEKRLATDAEYSSRLIKKLEDYPTRPTRVFVDPSATSFITQANRDGIRYIHKADNAVMDGIRRVSTLLSAARIKFHSRCVNTIRELQGYSWDSSSKAHGKDVPGHPNSHAPDALRYFVNGSRQTWEPWLLVNHRTYKQDIRLHQKKFFQAR